MCKISALQLQKTRKLLIPKHGTLKNHPVVISLVKNEIIQNHLNYVFRQVLSLWRRQPPSGPRFFRFIKTEKYRCDSSSCMWGSFETNTIWNDWIMDVPTLCIILFIFFFHLLKVQIELREGLVNLVGLVNLNPNPIIKHFKGKGLWKIHINSNSVCYNTYVRLTNPAHLQGLRVNVQMCKFPGLLLVGCHWFRSQKIILCWHFCSNMKPGQLFGKVMIAEIFRFL